MKKLLILASILLALTLVFAACGGDDPTETTGENVTVADPATDAPTEAPTDAPEQPTDAPEQPTTEPEVPTQEPEVPTQEPEVPTQEPEVPTEEPTADPAEPLHVVEPDFLANYAAQTGNLVCNSDLASYEVKAEAGRTFIRLIAGGGDPYIAFIDGSKNLKVARYMAVSYRTNSATDGQFFMGSGQGWTGNGDQFLQAWNEDGNWNLAIIDLDSVGLTALTDYVLNYARLDFFTDAGAEGDYFDIEYIAFFDTAEYAAAYDFEMHKAPMWDADKSVVAHQSFDQFYYGNGDHDAAVKDNLCLYHAANLPDWDFVANMIDSGYDYLTYWGWVATKSETIGQFGYQFNGGTPVYDAAWTHATEQPVIDAAKQNGGVNGSRMKIFIPVAGLEGENTLRVLYKDADGNEVCLNEITVILPENTDGPEVPPVETIVVDPRDLPAGSITGHMSHIVTEADADHYPMIAAAGLTSGAMIHQGSIYIGDYDLTNCTKVVIYYATDWGEGTQAGLAAAKEQGFGCIGVCAWDNNNVVNPDRNGFVGSQYTPDGGWAITAHELDVTALAYAGPVYVSADFLGGQFIIIDRVELVGATKLEPTTPEEPAKGELIHTSNDELRIMGTDNVTQIGQAFEPGKFDGWNKVITLEEGSFGGLIDWGWAAVNSTAYEFGYIINGVEIFSPLFNGPADPNVDAAIVTMGGNNGGRFLGMCAAAALPVGENNVKFAVKLDGGVTAIIREYTVIITAKPAPHEHDYKAEVTDPTCTEGGFTTYTCECGESYKGDETAALGHSYTNGVCSACGAADPDYVAVEMPAEFVLSLYQANLGKTLYFNGQMSGYYFAVSENVADAVKVYSEKVDGGYRMYFMDGDVKTYVDIVHRDAGRANVVLTTSPVGVYVWNADANTWTVTIEDTTFYLGTYGTYSTISASKISYITGSNAANVGVSQFPVAWADVPAAHEHDYTFETIVIDPTCTEDGYTVHKCECGDGYIDNEIAAAGHNYVDGACGICGEKDPDYVDPDAPVVPGGSVDFNTIELPTNSPNGVSSYSGSYTTANGWVIENSAIQCGGSTVLNPQFPVIGADNSSKAPCLNGKTSAPGKISSPTLNGGISKLTINYTKMFTDTVLSATVTITDLSTGAVYTSTIFKEADKDDKYSVWTFEWTLETPITGDFTIVIVNDCPSAVDKNKDRLTILSLAWEGAVEEPEVPAGETITVTTTDTYCFVDLVQFTAPVAGTYTFNLPAGMGAWDAILCDTDWFSAPYFDFYSNENGASFSVDIAENATYSFYIGATSKGEWTITYTFVEGEVGGDEPDTPDTPDIPDTPVEDISGTYYAGEDTVVIDAGMGTLVYTFTTQGGVLTTAEYTFEIVDGAVVLSNANGVIAEGMAIYFGKLELDENGVPATFWYNGNSNALSLGGGSEEPEEPDTPDVPVDNILAIGPNTIVVTDAILENGGVEYTLVVEAEGQYTFEGDFFAQILNGMGMMIGNGSAYLTEGTYTVNLGTFLLSGAGEYTLTVVYEAPEEPDEPEVPGGEQDGTQANPYVITSLPMTVNATGNHDLYYTYTAETVTKIQIFYTEGAFVTFGGDYMDWDKDDAAMMYVVVLDAGQTVVINPWGSVDATYEISGGGKK